MSQSKQAVQLEAVLRKTREDMRAQRPSLGEWITQRSAINEKPVQPPKTVRFHVTVQEEQWNGYQMFWLNRDRQTNPNVILYLHGGAYIAQPVAEHWSYLDDLAAKTGAAVLMPIYPLAPVHRYEEAYTLLDSIYFEYLKDIPRERLIVMGDSAGGSLAAGFLQSLAERSLPQPQRLVLFSPWMDLTSEACDCSDFIPLDPMTDSPMVYVKSFLWSGLRADRKHYKLSPIYGDFRGLPPITMFGGTHEALCPVLRKTAEIAAGQGADLRYIEGEDMIHVYPIVLALPDGEDARKVVYGLVGQA